MTLAIISLIINAILALTFLVREDVPGSLRLGLCCAQGACVVASLAGMAGFRYTGRYGYGILAMVSFVLSGPIGFLGAYGVWKMLEAERSR